ncbi:MAG: tetratricopeptide repeat protein [Phycisphaerales bacterium]|nr:tetratricopeptide repeat protein [Phycisphaerales bacterium]
MKASQHTQGGRHKVLTAKALVLLLSFVSGSAGAQPQIVDLENWTPPPDPRPVLAIMGFTAAPESDERDLWIPIACEELLARRLVRAPGVVVVPTLRLQQARRELSLTGDEPPNWGSVAELLGATHWLRATCSGTGDQLTIELLLHDLRHPEVVTEVRLPAGRLFDQLAAAVRWTLVALGVGTDLTEAQWEMLTEPAARRPGAVEYYALAVQAARSNDLPGALRWSGLALDADRRFRAALLLRAQLEAQVGPEGREDATRRLRVLSDLARLADDPFDRVRAELGLSLLLQTVGGFEAACQRAETALALAEESGDVYGQFTALTALCDAHLLRPFPADDTLTVDQRAGFARYHAWRAVEWQLILVRMLEARGDLLAALPAINKLGLIYDRLDEAQRAQARHKQTLALAERVGTRAHQATAWLYLGQWHRRHEQWPEALAALRKCFELAEEGTRPAVRMAMGAVYRSTDRPREALVEYEAAYAALRDGDDLTSQFVCLRELAEVRAAVGQRREAADALREALDIARVLKLPEREEVERELEALR